MRLPTIAGFGDGTQVQKLKNVGSFPAKLKGKEITLSTASRKDPSPTNTLNLTQGNPILKW